MVLDEFIDYLQSIRNDKTKDMEVMMFYADGDAIYSYEPVNIGVGSDLDGEEKAIAIFIDDIEDIQDELHDRRN